MLTVKPPQTHSHYNLGLFEAYQYRSVQSSRESGLKKSLTIECKCGHFLSPLLHCFSVFCYFNLVESRSGCTNSAIGHYYHKCWCVLAADSFLVCLSKQ